MLTEHAAHPVGAQEQGVSPHEGEGAEGAVHQLHLLHAQEGGEAGAVGVVQSGLRVQPALPDGLQAETLQVVVVPVEAIETALPEEVEVAVPHAEPPQLLPEKEAGHQGGAPLSLKAAVEGVVGPVHPGPELFRQVPLRVQVGEGGEDLGHAGLAHLPAVLQAAHAVGHHRQQTPAQDLGDVQGVGEGEGVLLPLPGAPALEVGHLVGEAPLPDGDRLLPPVKESHGRPPAPSRPRTSGSAWSTGG